MFVLCSTKDWLESASAVSALVVAQVRGYTAVGWSANKVERVLEKMSQYFVGDQATGKLLVMGSDLRGCRLGG